MMGNNISLHVRMIFLSICVTGGILSSYSDDIKTLSIDGVNYDYVDPGEPFEKGDPEQNWEAPKPTLAEQKAGMMVYVTADPGDYKPYRIPRCNEHKGKLSTFLTPGEDEPVWVGVSGLTNLTNITVTVKMGMAPVSIDIRYMHFWPQRTSWSARKWYITPELLLPCSNGKKMIPTKRGLLEERPFDLAMGETIAFWFTVRAQDDAVPGIYNADISIQGHSRDELKLPLRIEVLPFKLQRPRDKYWLLYADCNRWRKMRDSQVMNELRDLARHGITGLVEMPMGKIDISEIKSNKVSVDVSEFRTLAAQCKEAGLPGPHACSGLGRLAEKIRDKLELNCNLNKGIWPDEIKTGLITVAQATVQATADIPVQWYYIGADEPRSENTYAIQDYQCWAQGGAKTYVTIDDIRFVEKVPGCITSLCFGSRFISSKKGSSEARDACIKGGAEFWIYGTGCYTDPFPQEGFMFNNRYGAGYLFWKSGAQSEISWTFCRPHGDVFNDFDGLTANSIQPKEQSIAYPHLLKPDDWSTYQGAIPSIAWEALREGIDDYKYIYTLTQVISEARCYSDAALQQHAASAEFLLNTIIDSVPWADCRQKPMFETSRLQEARRAIADEIVRLQAALAGVKKQVNHGKNNNLTSYE